MLSENYTLVLFGIETKYFTNEYIAHLWEESANNEYNNSRIFVTARIDINLLVCGEIRGCTLGDTAHIITTARNPAEVPDEETFRNSYLNVVNEVRQRLGNPSMTIAIDRIEYFFFVKP